jgi:DNA-binding MarR family transcriptional regulator
VSGRPVLAPSAATAGAVGTTAVPWPALREAYLLLRERWTARLEKFGLLPSDFSALELCASAPAKASDVARATGVTAAGATDIIDRLEARALVRREADPEDRRVVRIRATPAGRRLFHEAQSTREETLRVLDRTMTEAERSALAEGLSALTRALRAARAGSPREV